MSEKSEKTSRSSSSSPGITIGQLCLRLHVDYAEPFQGEMFRVLVDAYSKWLEVHVIISTRSSATIEC